MLHTTSPTPRAGSAPPRVLPLQAKSSFTVRRVPRESYAGVVTEHSPRPGDLVLARVSSIGHHEHLQLCAGRRARLYVGDEILVCYGNRYATNQWEAIVPPTLERCDLVAAGGVAGKVLSRHALSRRPTGLAPLGLLGNDRGVPVNLRDHALDPRRSLPAVRVPLVAVVGTSMDAGKTTTASALIRGLALAGRRAAGIKVTGTGASGDYFQMLDAGASWVADFVDVGFVSTYRLAPSELELILTTLVTHATESGAEVIVLEVADGLAQAETASLLTSDPFRQVAGTVLLAAGDPLGAQAAVQWLLAAGLPVKAVSGLVTASTLSVMEARELTHLPVLGLDDLASPRVAEEWVENGR